MNPALKTVLLRTMEQRRQANVKKFKNQYTIGKYTPSKGIYITKLTTGVYNIYRHMGDCYWHKYTLTQGGDTDGPFQIYGMDVLALKSHILCDNAACSYTGTWTISGSNSYIYIGGKTRPNATNGNKVDISFNGGDVYVYFTGKTSGGHVKVEVDGASTLVEPSLPTESGYSYFNAYTPTDNFYKRCIKVASNIPAGEHTLTLTVTNIKDTASSGYAFYFTGIAIVSDTKGLPSGTDVRGKVWVADTAYSQFDHIEVEGRCYSCSTAGTTGTTTPTHTSGVAVDGTAAWTYITYSTYLDDYYNQIQASGSQLEYAYWYTPAGATTSEDVGGITHGNESLHSVAITVDGVAVDPSIGEWVNGNNITVTQVVHTTHSETGTTDNVTTTLIHEFTDAKMNIKHSHLFNVAATIGDYFYTAMWPILHWGAGFYKYCFDNIMLPGKPFLFIGNYGVSRGLVGRVKEYCMVATGGIFQPIGTSSAASPHPDKIGISAYLEITPKSVNNYKNIGRSYASCSMNPSATTPPSSSSTFGKMYFERYSSESNKAIALGEKIECEADYYLNLTNL